MKLYIQVVAFDEERGMKSTREQTVEVNPRIVKLNESLTGGFDAAIQMIAANALTSAVASAQSSSARSRQVLAEGAPPVQAAAAFGLDLIRAMDSKEGAPRVRPPRQRTGT